jgi:ATP-dependent protease ClpP protease subunit
MGLVIHHDLESRGGIYLLVNSVGGSLQAALLTVLYGLATSSAVLIGASGDFRVGLQGGAKVISSRNLVICGLRTRPGHEFQRLIGVPHVAFQFPRTEGLEWLNLTSRLALNGILFLPHWHFGRILPGLRSQLLHISGLLHGCIYLLVNSVGGSLQAALGLHD